MGSILFAGAVLLLAAGITAFLLALLAAGSLYALGQAFLDSLAESLVVVH